MRAIDANSNVLDRVTRGFVLSRGGLYVPSDFKARASSGDGFPFGGSGGATYAALQRDPTRRDQVRRYGSADADMALAIRELRATSQALMRNNPFYRMGVQAMVRNLAHAEYRVDPRPQTEFIKLAAGESVSKEQSRRVRKQSTHCFNLWKRTPEATGALNWATMLPLIIRSWMENGDVILLRQQADDSEMQPAMSWGRRFSFHWQLIEAGQVAEDAVLNAQIPDGHTVSGGVERDFYGRPVALHVYARHPGDASYRHMSVANRFEIERIPWRDAQGRPNVCLLFEPDRIGQSRGVPRGASAMLKAIDSDEFLDSALAQMKIATMLVGAITRNATNTISKSAQLNSKDNYNSRPIRPGMYEDLETGESIEFSSPPQTGQLLHDALDAMSMQYAGAIGQTYETLTGDFRKTTYSSARASFELAWMTTRMAMAIVEHTVCCPSYELMHEEAVLRGMITLPGYNPRTPDLQQIADPYDGYREEWVNASWIGPQMPRIDLEKEMKGLKLLVDEFYGTKRQASAKVGNDFDDVVAGQAEENEILADAGLTSPASANEAPDGADSEDEDNDDRDKRERREVDALQGGRR